MKLKFKKLDSKAVIPHKATSNSAGFDLTAIGSEYNSGTNCIIYKTGLACEIPEGYVGLLFSRSSVYKKQLSLANCVGVIDADYRGEIKAIFRNIKGKGKGLYEEEYYQDNERICQLVILPLPDFTPVEVEELSDTQRGEGGFGSSGK